ncbi:uncharacterized protein EI90DRAFT_2629450 [Cantharellus anzutake]|uniref:uncharacterized protein n=1 Tax=Cantharellus anzutake TaxID=1750568 RepID=UPI0019048B87|nr:uncharacterized protein EI90DRAFT_2629450 [Cantharellus anzutake]KAF8319557.1 hypothetical protein EI90DRAFT_2629450 [Cantharellus anzutake]
MKKQLLMSPHAHSPTTPQTTQSEGQTRHSAFQFHPHQPLSHLPRSQDHNTHLNAAFVQNNQQPPTVTIVPAPAHSSAPKSVQASSLTAPSPQPARIVGQGNTPSTTPSVQSVPLTSPVVAEGVAQEGVATVMSRTPSATSPIGREVKPNELSSSELASKPVFLRLFNHMFEQVSGLPKIEYECTFCRCVGLHDSKTHCLSQFAFPGNGSFKDKSLRESGTIRTNGCPIVGQFILRCMPRQWWRH